MQELFDIDAWRQVVTNALTELGDGFAGLLPQLVGTLALLVVGWVVSRALEAVSRRLLEKLGLDRALSRQRVGDVLRRAGVASPSRIFARLLFWTIMLTFLLSAVETLGFTAVTSTIDRLVAYLPNVIAAGLIVLLGLVVGRFTRNVVASGAAAANLPNARRLGTATGSLVVLFISVLALEQLGLETALLVTLLTVLVGAACLTMGVAFALGSRPIVTHVLAGHFLRQTLPPGSTLEVGGRKGTLERVGAVDTLLRDGGGAWSVPNAALLDETIVR